MHSIWRMDWLDGPWFMASATVAGDPPAFLKRGTRASFRRWDLDGYEPEPGGREAHVIRHAFVGEVSVLLGKKPGEPLAEVLSMRRGKSSPASGYRLKPGETFIDTPPGQMVRRYYETPITIR